MSVDTRQGFNGLLTNASSLAAPPSTLIEAENVVLRRPGALEPRDGLAPVPNADGTEVWGLAHQKRDLLVRSDGTAFTYHDLLGATLTNPPQPLRRDILTSAEARGNLYVPAYDGVWRLVEGSDVFERAGLMMTSQMTRSLVYGPPERIVVDGTEGFTPSTFLDNAAGQGPVQSGTFWLAVQFFLHSMPQPGGPAQYLMSRGTGVYPSSGGYLIQFASGLLQFVWQPTVGSAIFSSVVSFSESDVGRMHVAVIAFNGGNGRIWLDGRAGTLTPSAPPTSAGTDVTTWGNGRMHSNTPALTSGALVSAAYGTQVLGQAEVDTIYAEAKTWNGIIYDGAIPPSRFWLFTTSPPQAPVGGQVPTVTAGPAPVLNDHPVLWPGDPENYPDEFWLPRGYHAAYRLVGLEKDAGGLVRRSAPSGMFEVSFPADRVTSPENAGAAYVIVDVRAASSEAPTYDTVEVYRSRVFPIGTAIDDEMQLVGTVPAPTFPSASQLIDDMPQSSRGATLYTSPSRGGIIQQNDPPPACACTATFKGSLFFANTRGPATLVLSFDLADGDLAGQESGIGTRTVPGTTTMGQFDIELATADDALGIEPGQTVVGPNVPPPLDPMDTSTYPRVTSVSGTTVTMDVMAIGSGSGSYQFTDVLWLGDKAVFAGGLYNTGFYVPASATQVVPPLDGKQYTYVLTSWTRAPVAEPFTVRASHGGDYAPPLPGYNDTPKLWDQDVSPGKIMWSKPDEPEHVAPVYYAFVGDLKKACLGLVPTRDALFILKEDGVFRLTGVNATWRIDPYDPTLFCALPNSVRPLQEMAYFLSNKGVIAFSDAGAEMISVPINDQVKPVIDRIYDGFRQTGLYELPGSYGSFAGVFERENEYTLMMGEGGPSFVYNRNTLAWTTLKIFGFYPQEETEVRNIFNAPNAGRVVYVQSLDSVPASWTWLTTDAQQWGAGGLPPHFDAEWETDIQSVLTGSYTAVTIFPWRPLLRDDVIVDDDGVAWRVESDAGGSEDAITLVAQPIEGGFRAPATGDALAYRTIRCSVVPQPFTTPPARPKRWRALSTAFERLRGPVTLRYAYASAESPRWPGEWDEEEADAPVKMEGALIDYPMGYAYAGLVPSAHSRSWSLRGGIRWALSHGEVRLEGIYVEAEMVEIGRQQRAL